MKYMTLFIAALAGLLSSARAQDMKQLPDSLAVLDKNPHFTAIKPSEFQTKLAKTKKLQLLDVRTPAEYKKGHIKGAKNLDINQPDFLRQAESTLSKETPVAVYCKSGVRSRKAALQLLRAGFTVYNLQDGYEGWKKVDGISQASN